MMTVASRRLVLLALVSHTVPQVSTATQGGIGEYSMERVRLDFDMADRMWFEPYTTIEAEVDTGDVPFFYQRRNVHFRIARLLHNGREFVLMKSGATAIPWQTVFGATVAVLTNSSWIDGLRTDFEGIAFESVGKVVVTLPERVSV